MEIRFFWSFAYGIHCLYWHVGRNGYFRYLIFWRKAVLNISIRSSFFFYKTFEIFGTFFCFVINNSSKTFLWKLNFLSKKQPSFLVHFLMTSLWSTETTRTLGKHLHSRKKIFLLKYLILSRQLTKVPSNGRCTKKFYCIVREKNDWNLLWIYKTSKR